MTSVAAERQFSKWTPVVQFIDGVRYETALGRLDREARDQLRLILEVLDTEEQA